MAPRILVVVAALRLAASVYAASADPVQPRPAPADDWSGLERTTITKIPSATSSYWNCRPSTSRRAP